MTAQPIRGGRSGEAALLGLHCRLDGTCHALHTATALLVRDSHYGTIASQHPQSESHMAQQPAHHTLVAQCQSHHHATEAISEQQYRYMYRGPARMLAKNVSMYFRFRNKVNLQLV